MTFDIRHHTIRLLLLGPLVTFPGCGRSDMPEDVSLDDLPSWSVQETARFGSHDGEDALGTIEALVLDGEGRVHLLEREERAVRVFDRSGAFQFRIGRPGMGPGEFERPISMGWDGERLRIFDFDRGRLTWFLDGEPVDQRSISPLIQVEGEEFSYWVREPLPGGEWAAAPLVPPAAAAEREDWFAPVVRLDSEGALTDTLWTDAPGDSALSFRFNGANYFGSQPFSLHPLRAIDWRDTTVVEVAYELEPAPHIVVEKRRIGGEAGTVFRSEIPFEPDPVTEGEVTEALELLTGSTPEMRSAVRDALLVPESRRPVHNVVIAEDGRLWLRMTLTATQGGAVLTSEAAQQMRQVPPGHDHPGTRWVVLSPDGAPEGRVRLPTRLRPMWIEDDVIWGTSVDDFGVSYVVEYEVD